MSDSHDSYLSPVRPCCPLVILEGPDGAGKTTLAKLLVAGLSARYAHLGAMERVTKNLSRFYLEAMLPALQGYQAVVMDRAWFSERPYHDVFRPDKRLRNDAVDDAMLERAALRCPVVVVSCVASDAALTRSFLARRGDEYLDRAEQVLAVARAYEDRLADTALHVVTHSYERDPGCGSTIAAVNDALRAQVAHPAELASAGSLSAEVLLVGDAFAGVAPEDLLQQYPFVTFSGLGCSRWLTQQLVSAGIGEHELAWINQDQGLDAVLGLAGMMGHLKKIVPLGSRARACLAPAQGRLRNLHRDLVDIDDSIEALRHPQSHKRFLFTEPYPLIPYLKELLR